MTSLLLHLVFIWYPKTFFSVTSLWKYFSFCSSCIYEKTKVKAIFKGTLFAPE